MTAVNRQGLGRYIPEHTKRRIRSACGFGCVVCGTIPYEYDHLETEFNASTDHDPDDIVLLCDRCHKLKGKSLSVSTIKKARVNRSGVNSEFRFKLPATSQELRATWAGNKIIAADNSITVDGIPVLNFCRSENDLEPIVISGEFRDRYGNVICRVKDNEFVGRAEYVGDFTLVANRFKYTLPGGMMGLEFHLSDHEIDIRYAFHVLADAHVFANNRTLRVGNLHSGVVLKDCLFSNVARAIEVGTTTDSFAYDGVNVERFPANFMTQCEMAGANVGILISGRRRYRPTYTMNWSG